MIKNKMFLISYKVFFALLGFSAVVTEMVTLIERGNFKPENFFSYFTIETNILVVIVLLLSAFVLAAGKAGRLDALRGATTVYILIVGIGFSLLLSTVKGLTLTAVPWDNTVLHYIIPVAVLVDFLIDRPKRSLPLKKSLTWLLFPLAYIIYTMTRGTISGWYPYPFLNPATKGYSYVAMVVFGLFALGLVLMWCVGIYTTRRKKR